jgi:hypothetical protein
VLQIAVVITFMLFSKTITIKRGIRQVAKMTNVSMTVQRGNAASIMGTLGPLRKLNFPKLIIIQ